MLEDFDSSSFTATTQVFAIPFPLMRHSINLSRSIKGRNPLYTLGSEELGTRLDAVDDTHLEELVNGSFSKRLRTYIIKNTCLDDPHAVRTAKGITKSEKRGSAITAEAAGDRFPAIRSF